MIQITIQLGDPYKNLDITVEAKSSYAPGVTTAEAAGELSRLVQIAHARALAALKA